MANRVAIWWKERALQGQSQANVIGTASALHAWWIETGYTTNMDNPSAVFNPPGGNCSYGGQFVIDSVTTVGLTRRIFIDDLASTPSDNPGLTVNTLAVMRSGSASPTGGRAPFLYYDTIAGLPVTLSGQTILISWSGSPAFII